ncbi:MAG: hypothetical protein ACPL7K_08960, partial [Armatimonadota bacterium]
MYAHLRKRDGARFLLSAQVSTPLAHNSKVVELTDIDLGGFGAFTESECGFRVNRYHLEEAWSYIYVTRKILLRVDQRGIDYVQLDPPCGTVLLRRERFQKHPSILVWIKTGEAEAFTNFWGPTIGRGHSQRAGESPAETAGCVQGDAREPDEFCCDYASGGAVYRLRHGSVVCETELFLPPDEPVVVMNCRVTNAGTRRCEMNLVPAIRPHMASASLAPWDVPALYQSVSYSNEICPLFDLELRSP